MHTVCPGPSESPGLPEDPKADKGRLSHGPASTSGSAPQTTQPFRQREDRLAGLWRSAGRGEGAEARSPGRALWSAGRGEGAGPPTPPQRAPLPATGLLVFLHCLQLSHPPARAPHLSLPLAPQSTGFWCSLRLQGQKPALWAQGRTLPHLQSPESGVRRPAPQASSDACVRGKLLAPGCRGCPSWRRTWSFSGVW